MKLLEGKTAIITGSSRGIGRAAAMAFASHGAGLVIHSSSEESSRPLAEELGCAFVAGDIGELSTSQRLADECMSRYGRIDILVNNAGINSRTKFLDLTPDEWDRILRVNLTGAFYACQCVIPHMLAQKAGVIINIVISCREDSSPDIISLLRSKQGRT